MAKKLSVAFVWHMHQPTYKDRLTNEYLMPWVRLHAIKDYLDMLLILEEFPNIKQTFNIVPSLIDQLNDYGHNDAHDRHSRLTETEVSLLSDGDKTFILEHFFDANYINMISPHESYRKLYEKRFQQENLTINSFSDQEYSDILAWFNLAWFDPYWLDKKPELAKLYQKGTGFTLEDRKQIISIQRELIRSIVPKYRELFEKGQIEISTSPYYHPILPLLIDLHSAQVAIPNIQLPEYSSNFSEDAETQILKGIKKFKDIFGKSPNGIWPSEQCISPESLELMSKLGIKWTITDEGNLSKTLEKEFIRDFHGDLEDPYDLCKAYNAEINGKNIFILFRNSILADLIAFEYGNHDPEIAANDLYERIKNIQSKLQITPEKNHIVTIALDGENCWESYKEDGRIFLKNLYSLLSEDESLDITTISNFIENAQQKTTLPTIHSGSWINRNFQLWIGDPTKNLAWDYLNKTRLDLIKFIQKEKFPQKTINKAWEEIYIAEGSDWFWWYGEPNDSGQDDLFDALFRMHMQNVYKILNKPVPDYLNISLDLFIGKPSRNPRGILQPIINGELDSDEEWALAGCIEVPQGPMYQSDKFIRRILFGCDQDNIYFRFDINAFDFLKSANDMHLNALYLYCSVPGEQKSVSPIRQRNKSATIYQTQRCHYAFEIEIPLSHGSFLPPILSEAIEGGLWKIKMIHSIKHKYKTILELSIPFADLDIERTQEVQFTIATTKSGILQAIIPQNKPISFRRP